jgi:pimeloyl-ACP methyl ester carboxylesterase
MRPFRFEPPDGAVDDLRRRLAATRWPDVETVDDRSQGVPLAELGELCRYWAEEYDWTAAVARINAMPQLMVGVDGLDVHVAHLRSPHGGALPLLLTHGWPGSFLEFADVAQRLADPTAWGGDPADAFHVVCPSLPGFGFSGRPAEAGWGPARTAAAWRRLMTALGYDRFGVQGGDWGARVSQIVAATDDRVVGTHLNFVLVAPDPDTLGDLTDGERAALDDVAHMDRWGRGYFVQQMTRPQTVGYGLNDSPAGLCAWIAEKVVDWSDPASTRPTRDQLLDNVSLYWLTGTAASSARMYWESGVEPPSPVPDGPVGCTIFPRELRRPSRRWAAEVFPGLCYWNEVDAGGHFAAWEQPELFADEVRAFFRLVR